MPLSNELRQRLVLVLQKQGTESIDEVRGMMRELQGEFQKAGEALSKAFTDGTGDIVEFTKLTAEITREYNELSKLIQGVEEVERRAAEAAGEALRKRIDGWARADSELQAYQKRLQEMAAAETAAAEASAMEQHLRDMGELQQALGRMEAANASQRAEGERETAAALERGNQAVRDRMEQLDRQRQAEGDALRAKAEGYARIERMGEEQLERERKEARESLLAQKEAAGQAIRERAEMHARIERMAEQANAAAKQQLGDSIRAAAERHARIEEMEEEQHRQNLARMAAEAKAAESLANQKALYERLNSKGLNKEQAKALEALTESIRDGAKFTDEYVQKFNRLGDGMDAAQQKSKNFAMGLMALAHAGQDLQYGFGAVVNNIPQIAYAMANAIPALENYAMQFSAIAMIGGTLANVAMPKIKEFVTSFATEIGLLNDPLRTAAVSTDQVKAKLEALQSKSWKVDFDYSMIEMAEKRLTLLEERQKKWEEMSKARTSVEQESGKRASEAITGQGNMDGLIRAMTESMGKMGLLKMDTEAQRNLRSAEAEMEQLRKTMNDPNISPFDFMTASGRNLVLETQLPAMKAAVRDEIRGIVEKELGAAGRGEKQKVADVLAAVNANPDAFRNQGIDPMKLAAGLMGAEHETIRDQRESEKFAEEQARDAKRRKRLDDDLVDDLNRQGQAAQAETDRILKEKREKAQQLSAQLAASGRAADAEARAAEKAARDAARADKADDRAMGQLLRNNAAADKKAAKVEAAEELAQQFAGFAPDFAAHGGRLLRDRLNRGEPEQAAFNAVYNQLLKAASQQEQAAGMIGEATQRLMVVEQQQRMIQARLNQVQGQLGRGRNKKQTLLPHPAQR